MISVGMFIPITIVFAIVQISFFRAFPDVIRRYLAYYPLVTLGLNMFGSFFILMFTGTAFFVGPMNLTASVVFAGYIFMYKKVRGIKKVKRGRFRFAAIVEENPNGNFIF